MLLFIAKRHIGLELSEQAHLAVQAGCGWIQVCIDVIPDQDARAQLSVIANECREQGVILTIEDNPELAAEMGVHGVYISESSTNARALREKLGAEAIIGIAAASASSVGTLAALDIDYVTIPTDTGVDEAAAFVKTVRDAGVNTPIVAVGAFAAANIRAMIAAGVNGFALSLEDIGSSSDAVRAIDCILSTINSVTKKVE